MERGTSARCLPESNQAEPVSSRGLESRLHRDQGSSLRCTGRATMLWPGRPVDGIRTEAAGPQGPRRRRARPSPACCRRLPRFHQRQRGEPGGLRPRARVGRLSDNTPTTSHRELATAARSLRALDVEASMFAAHHSQACAESRREAVRPSPKIPRFARDSRRVFLHAVASPGQEPRRPHPRSQA